MDKQHSIVLFAFRKSHMKFFENIIKCCKNNHLNILSTKNAWKISFKNIKKLKNVDLESACAFAIDEFYAKTNLKIPKIVLKLYFKTFSYINFMRYDAALEDHIEKVLIWNGGKFRQRIAIEVAKIKQIKVYYFENGLLPNTLVFDAKGINYNNSVPRDQAFFRNYSSTVKLPTTLVTKVGKGSQKFIGKKEVLPDKYIFVPFQVDYDTQIISHSRWIKNMRMLFDVIAELAKQSTYHFVLKEHPSSGVDYEDLHERVKSISNMSFRNTHLTQELIEQSEAVITINSTVGVESLLFHKKLMVLGDAFYKIEGICYGVNTAKELFEKVSHLERLSLDVNLIDNFLKYLYHDYLILEDDDMYKIVCNKLLDN